MRELKNFTIKEFEQYQELLQEDVLDEAAILELFGVDINTISMSEFKDNMNKINSMTLNAKLKKYYVIKGVRYKASLNIMKINAAQFIDFQAYMKDFKIEQVLSIFMIPQTKTWYGWKDGKYNTGYNPKDVINAMYDEFKMSDAKVLSDFFLSQSTSLLKIMKDYLTKKMYLMKKKQIKDLKNPK